MGLRFTVYQVYVVHVGTSTSTSVAMDHILNLKKMSKELIFLDSLLTT